MAPADTRQFPSYDTARKELPIYTYREELLEAIRDHQVLVVVGDTGSGKTTQLPQYVLESLPEIRKICVTQPRRIAALSAARRVAEESKTRIGTVVGYSIRFERRASPETRLLYVTDGTLLRAVESDPEVRAYDLVILDEAHERSIETDVLFGLLRRACRLRPELKIVVMSATLDIDKFSDFFGEAPVFSIPGRMYAVDIFWQKQLKLGTAKATFVRRAVDTVMHIHKNEEPGDVLVFLTGQSEIEQAIRMVQEAHDELDYVDVKYRSRVRTIALYPIFSALETLEQRAIFDPAPEGVRKVVFATNIAQTSVTIPGITYVVDSGFVKQKMYDPQTAIDALMVVPISQAAATQRAGRAGRTGIGKVFRLYSRDAFDDMDAATVPEIQRSALLGTVLALKTMGIDDILNFEFIDPPDPDLVIAATKQLFWLGAVDEHGHLTPLGKQMAAFPISPYLSRTLVSAALDFHCSYEMLVVAAMLSVEEVYAPQRSKKKQAAAEACWQHFNDPTGDHLTLLRIFTEWEATGFEKKWAFDNFLHHRALRAAKEVRGQLEDVMRTLGLPITKAARIDILRALCTAFYTNTAKKHPSRAVSTPSSMMALCLHPQSSLADSHNGQQCDFVIYNDVQYVNRATMRVVSKVHLDWVRVLMGRLTVLDEARLTGSTGITSPTRRTERRPSLIDIATRDLDATDSQPLSEDDEKSDHAGEKGSGSTTNKPSVAGKPEFVLEHEVIDESHQVEFAIGSEFKKPSPLSPQPGLHTHHSHPSSSATINQPPAVPCESDSEERKREQVLEAAKARYLKRRKNRSS
ncbi:P-loop containing nucleoside triphosphate hydrolase protein [Powellomyces hirtus]|nr:P-loop containing nucleoside triphosphate hydrolase protein [Powellomyces hirtus]